eukprot:CAMPEP_0117451294 /NCGR_PEP_ID=MMETSP0759-20121206/8929_1 /TAXON_ID=63605 /ORGANISM="Percolomonas cosmopolitus, Strain WS" /LENGTH=137 /DNA_ID=CAMNT_0005243881 /DNA_START=43 /DNA_END=456 /DNA_ORIENTATION=-
MGSTISSSMGDAMERNQKSMSKLQEKNMKKGQERMRRVMMAQQMALARDRFQWMSGVYSVILTGVTARCIHSRTSPPPQAIVPLIVAGTVIAWHWDMAYGTKMNRINTEMAKITQDTRYWFVPIDAPFLEENEEERA